MEGELTFPDSMMRVQEKRESRNAWLAASLGASSDEPGLLLRLRAAGQDDGKQSKRGHRG